MAEHNAPNSTQVASELGLHNVAEIGTDVVWEICIGDSDFISLRRQPNRNEPPCIDEFLNCIGAEYTYFPCLIWNEIL
jgi:hypothetical protein